MTDTELVDRVIVKPRIKRLTLPVGQGGLGLTVSDLRSQLGGFIPSVVSEVAGVHSWDFALKETTHSGGSVANTANYTLEGDDKDCLSIFNVHWGSGDEEILLKKKTQAKMDAMMSRASVDTPTYWLANGRTNNHPIIKIVSAPTTSGTTITYKYWRENYDILEIPSSLDYLLEIALAKRLDATFGGDFWDNEVSQAIASYERSGGETNVAEPDSEIVACNVRRSRRQGWSGGPNL